MLKILSINVCLNCTNKGIDGAGAWYPACAPDHLSNLRFWDALNGEAWFINATEYGHTDMMDEDKQRLAWVNIFFKVDIPMGWILSIF